MPTPHDADRPQGPAVPPALPTGEQPLLSLRAFTVLLGAGVGGATAGALAFWQMHSPSGAVGTGVAAFFLGVQYLHKHVG